MKILYMGGGFVGATSAAVAADSGHDVLVFDVDAEKVRRLSSKDPQVIQSCLREEGLADLLIRNASRIKFTTGKKELEKFLGGVGAVFMCLPTPEKLEAEGESDLSFYEEAAAMIGPMLANRDDGRQEKRMVIVNKSTVPIRMIDFTAELFDKQGVRNFGIVSNPEFLVEGKAVEGSVRPNRVVVGAKNDEDFEIMREIYRRFYDSTSVTYIEVNPYEAAAGKLLSNFLLFNKVVTTFDVIGRACEFFPNLGFEEIRKVLAADPRIGSWGLYDSLFAGGSCFIKDAGSLAHQLERAGADACLIRSTLEANVFQRDHFFGRAETEAGFSWDGKTVAVLGLSFKQDTNDIRNSGALGILRQLLGSGVASIRAYDPAAMDETRKFFDPKMNVLNTRITYCQNEAEALKGTQAVIVCTDWPQFKGLAEKILEHTSAPYLILDGRRMMAGQFEKLSKNGYDIISVGSPLIKGEIDQTVVGLKIVEPASGSILRL